MDRGPVSRYAGIRVRTLKASPGKQAQLLDLMVPGGRIELPRLIQPRDFKTV